MYTIILYKKIICLFLTILLSVTLSSCSDKKYTDFENEYYKLYRETVGTMDFSSTEKAIEYLNTDEIKPKIDKLGDMIANIDDKVPDSKKEEYVNVIKRSYNGLCKLQEANNRWASLSAVERSELFAELMNIQIMIKID